MQNIVKKTVDIVHPNTRTTKMSKTIKTAALTLLTAAALTACQTHETTEPVQMPEIQEGTNIESGEHYQISATKITNPEA